jgi:YVTN family beta-propeller protein
MIEALDNANNELAIIGEFVQGSDNGNGSSNSIDRSNNTIAFTVYNPTPSVLPAKLFNYDSSYFLPAPPPSVVGVPIAVPSPLSMAYCPVNNFLYISSGTPSVEVLDTATNTIVTSIPFGPGVGLIAYNSSANTIYVPDQFANNVNIIDCATNLVIGLPIPVSPFPIAVIYNPLNNRIYVSSGSFIDIIDCSTNLVIANVPTGIIAPGILALNPTTNSIYFIDTNPTNIVSVLDCNTNLITTFLVGVGATQIWIEYCTPNNTMYITNNTSNDVTVINCVTNSVVGAPINVGAAPFGSVYNSFDNLIYVANPGSFDISVIDCSTNLVVNTIPTGAFPVYLAYNFLSNIVYASSFPFNQVLSISPSIPFVASAIVTPSGGVTPAEIFNDTQGKPFAINGLKMITSNFQQYSNNITTVNTSYTGADYNLQLQPLNYVSPSNNPNILDMTDFQMIVSRGPDSTSINFNVEPFTKVIIICTIGTSLDPMKLFSKGKIKVQESKVNRNTGNPIIDMILKHDFKDGKTEDGYYTTTEKSIYPRLTGNPIADIALFRESGVQGIG